MNATIVHAEPAHADYAHTDPVPPMPRRISWGAIFAGAVIGLALMVLLTLLGVGIGAATIDPIAGDSLAGAASGSAIYLGIVQLVSLFVGGFAAARLAGVPFKQGSMLHGAAVWSLATFAMFWLATTAVGALAGGVASTVSKASQGIATAADAAVPDDLSVSDLSLPNVDMQSLPPSVRNALQRQNLTIEQARQEMRAAFNAVIGEQERQRATSIATDTARDVINSPGDATRDIESMVDRLLGGPNAVLSEEDRQQAMTQMNERLGISEAEAEQMIDQAQAQVQQAGAEVEQALDTARTQALQAADAAQSALTGAALGAFVASLLGLIAAVIGALVGRPKEIVDPSAR